MARPLGSKNKSTEGMRLVLSTFLDNNSHKMQGWLDQIEKDEGPLEAFKRVESILEYCIPKLQRSELTGADGKDLPAFVVTVEHVEKR